MTEDGFRHVLRHAHFGQAGSDGPSHVVELERDASALDDPLHVLRDRLERSLVPATSGPAIAGDERLGLRSGLQQRPARPVPVPASVPRIG
jgi:hypothetical protein